MELEGRFWKSGDHWLIEVPALDVMTQGYSKEEAIFMIRDAILEYIYFYFETQIDKDFDIHVNVYKNGVIGIVAKDSKILLSLSLRRQREMAGTTVREAAERIGSTSPNSYAQYEKGKTRISLDQYDKLLRAANPFRHTLLRVV